MCSLHICFFTVHVRTWHSNCLLSHWRNRRGAVVSVVVILSSVSIPWPRIYDPPVSSMFCSNLRHGPAYLEDTRCLQVFLSGSSCFSVVFFSRTSSIWLVLFLLVQEASCTLPVFCWSEQFCGIRLACFKVLIPFIRKGVGSTTDDPVTFLRLNKC